MAKSRKTTGPAPEPAKTRSWFARYWKTGDMCLLGGVNSSHTSRFGTREDAEARLAGVVQVNGGAGRPCEGEVLPSSQAPEIFTHCDGYPSQAVGGHCPGCRRLLTLKDAEEYGDAHAS